MRALIGIFLATALTAQAGDWINADPAGSSWAIPSNWSNGAVPDSNSFLPTIGVGKAIISTAATAYNPSVENNAVLEITGAGSFTGHDLLPRGGNIIIDAGATVTLEDGFGKSNLENGSLVSTGATLKGNMGYTPNVGKSMTVSVSGGTLNANSYLSFGNDGTDPNGAVTATFGGGVKVSGGSYLSSNGNATVTFTGIGTTASVYDSSATHGGTIAVKDGAVLSLRNVQTFTGGKYVVSGGGKIQQTGNLYLGYNAGGGEIQIGAGGSIVGASQIWVGDDVTLTLDVPASGSAAAITGTQLVWRSDYGKLKLVLNPPAGNVPAGYTWDFLTAGSFNVGSGFDVDVLTPGWDVIVGTNKLTLVAVPEPGVTALLAFAGLVLISFRRRAQLTR
jgi:hypothetical protein